MNHRDSRRYYQQDRNYQQRWQSGQMQEYPPRRYESDPKEYIPQQYEPRIQKRPRDLDYRPQSVNPQQSRMQNDYRMQNRYNDDQRYMFKRYDEDKRPPSRFDRYDNRFEDQNPPIYQNYNNVREQSREEKERIESNHINEAISFIKNQQKVNPPIELFPTPIHFIDYWD